MTVFSDTWDAAFEADPADGDAASGGALDIRTIKIATQERGEVDHSWAGNTDDGAHKKITFVDPLAAKPTQANDESYLYTKDVAATSELFYEDEAGNEVQLTNAGSGDGFPSGTLMLFAQSAAPTGWTRSANAALNNSAIKVFTTGTWLETAGTVGFSQIFDGSTLTTGAPSAVTGFTAGAVNGGSDVHTHDLTMDLRYVGVILAAKD